LEERVLARDAALRVRAAPVAGFAVPFAVAVVLSLSARRDSAPLCPAGHLPHEGGDQLSRRLSPIANVAE
jgi:hypothetical protein